MKNMQYTLILIFTLFLLFSCESNVSDPGLEDSTGELQRELTAVEKMLIEADQSFSYDIFQRTVVNDSDNENVFISPLSISMALAMTLNGAQGETFEDIRGALYLNAMDSGEINKAYQSLIKLLVSADPDVTLKIANSIWYDEWLPVKEEFREQLLEYYDAEISGLDFNDPASVDIINEWVNENTEGLIEKIVEDIPEEMVLYLINAIYFKGDWLQQFDPDDTQKADFNLESGEQVDVDMMSQEGRFATYFSNDVQMIELPYGDSLYTMTVMMPGDPDMAIDDFVNEKVTASNLENWRSNLTVDSRNVTVNLPKFELGYEIEYSDILKSMGMEIAFDDRNADFSGIADLNELNEPAQHGLAINEVKHKTFIRVDEEGSEAAAVTSVGVGIVSMPPQMIVNRPFVFIIYERESGANLFMGKMKNPVL
ncbi:MAG: serpin family protein [Balneolaceae bacterium]